MPSRLGGTRKQGLAMRYCEPLFKRPLQFLSKTEADRQSSKSCAFLTRRSKRLNEQRLTAPARGNGILRPVQSTAADPGGRHRTAHEWRQHCTEFKHGVRQD